MARPSLHLLSSLLLLVPLACTEPPSAGDTDNDESSGEGDEDDQSGDGDGDVGELGPTWYQDIAPIVAERCGGCHTPGSIGPFSLETYEEGSAWASLALDAIESGQMPPWGEDDTEDCQPRLDFLDSLAEDLRAAAGRAKDL